MSSGKGDGVVVTNLSNGMPLLVQEMSMVPSTAVVVLAKVGSRHEDELLSGIAHFEEHMVFKGTTLRPTTLDISSLIDGVGGDFNAFTDKQYTGFYIKTATKDAELSFDVLADMLFNSTFAEEEVVKERQVILEEMNMYNDSPRERVGELYDTLLYGRQPLGRDIIGTKASLARVGSAELKQFNADWYGSESLLISVAGSLKADRVNQLAERYFAGRDKGRRGVEAKTVVAQAEPAISVTKKQTDQTHMVLGVRSFAVDDPRRHALSLLNVILGGTMSSRLFIEVRERRGLAYSVFTGVDAMSDVGSFVCQVGLDHRRVTETVEVILQQLALTGQELVPEVELERAKRFIRGKMALSTEDPLSLNMFAARQQLQLGKVEGLETLLRQIEQVTAEQIREVAQQLFVNEGLNLAVIGSEVEEEGIKRVLRF